MMPRDRDGEEEEEEGKRILLSTDVILPDELLQKVLSSLSIANIIKLGIVCKRWYEVVHSYPPSSWAMISPQNPLFFRTFYYNSIFSGRVYDPCFLRWYNFDLPRLEKGIRYTSSSCGLVCLLNPNSNSLLVGNPIKRDWKLLPQVPIRSGRPRYDAIALSFDRRTRGYTVVFTNSTITLLPGMFRRIRRCHLSVHIYQSTTKSWTTPFAQDIGRWIATSQAVICDGVLYHFIRHPDLPPRLMAFDLIKPPSSIQSLIQESIPTLYPLPYPVFTGGFISLSNKLFMVRFLNWKFDGPMILELEDKRWRGVARLPKSMYKQFVTPDFICCGAGDFLFMHSPHWPELLTFDMKQKEWKWSSYPYTDQLGDDFKSASRFYYGFCFEPRLDVSS